MMVVEIMCDSDEDDDGGVDDDDCDRQGFCGGGDGSVVLCL